MYSIIIQWLLFNIISVKAVWYVWSIDICTATVVTCVSVTLCSILLFYKLTWLTMKFISLMILFCLWNEEPYWYSDVDDDILLKLSLFSWQIDTVFLFQSTQYMMVMMWLVSRVEVGHCSVELILSAVTHGSDGGWWKACCNVHSGCLLPLLPATALTYTLWPLLFPHASMSLFCNDR